jgi:hypothetical protein
MLSQLLEDVVMGAGRLSEAFEEVSLADRSDAARRAS